MVHLMVQSRAHLREHLKMHPSKVSLRELQKDVQESALEVAPKILL